VSPCAACDEDGMMRHFYSGKKDKKVLFRTHVWVQRKSYLHEMPMMTGEYDFFTVLERNMSTKVAQNLIFQSWSHQKRLDF